MFKLELVDPGILHLTAVSYSAFRNVFVRQYVWLLSSGFWIHISDVQLTSRDVPVHG